MGATVVGLTEADTCRIYVLPKLREAGWTDEQISEQRTFTDGRVIVSGDRIRRRKGKRADYILYLRRNVPLAVIEAKPVHKTPGDGLQQAKDYAEILGLRFAYATNGTGIVEFDFTTGRETRIDRLPSPAELWARLRSDQKLDDTAADHTLTPYHHDPEQVPRYYQEIAINRTVQAILQGRRRVLLTLATGTGKTLVSFQIAWRLWNAGWNLAGAPRRPQILFLADRSILVDDPKDKTFAPFGDARHKIEGEAKTSREMYFATYQAIARDERRPGIYKDFAPDFFDLVIIDECHRGSATDDSNWRQILDHFTGAAQLGMTATPLREDNKDTYEYFGDPLYTYSLRQGIEDGFLAPYRVHRVVTSVDATGFRPARDETDRAGQAIPDRVYTTQDFDSVLFHEGRRKAVARHLADFMRKTDRFGKTIVFCPTQEAADLFRADLNNLNADLVREHPDYVCRVVSDEGAIGKGHLSRFQDIETSTPVILTTSQLLTTGVDAPTIRNVVIAKTINSMTEFKQVIGRGTRLRTDYGKYFFTILDYTGSATRLFADPDFDGDPARVTEETTDEEGKVVEEADTEPKPSAQDAELLDATETVLLGTTEDETPRRFYVDGDTVTIAADIVMHLAPDGTRLKVERLTDYTRDRVRTLFPTAAHLRARWAEPSQREALLAALDERGIDLGDLCEAAGQPEADPFDLLCHVTYSLPVRTRRERADRVKREQGEFLSRFRPEAREILEELLEKYAEHGLTQLGDARVLQAPPLDRHGNILEIASRFGGPEELRAAISELQVRIYAS